MSTNNIHFHDRTRKFPKISLNMYFLERSEDVFEPSTVNEPYVFQPLWFNCMFVVVRKDISTLFVAKRSVKE